MIAEPTVEVCGRRIETAFIAMVESALLAGATFSDDGYVLTYPDRGNPDALVLFEVAPDRVALSLQWVRAHAASRGLSHLFQVH
jgi:hypothetical protein